MICIGGVPVLKRHFGGPALKYFTVLIRAGGQEKSDIFKPLRFETFFKPLRFEPL